ncbi:tetratricopeptide repeat protein [Arcobacter sp. YIC-80]|uniref:tetratricopeptide repeat protein n=1 Tax=Arcobacter sp. YIC-80 TaxID=3376683 RepID=UPI00385064B5
MHNSFFKSIILTFIFLSSLFASNEEINQKLFELKTSQEYAPKINDEKITLIMGQIILKENEIKELENKLDELRKDNNSLDNYKNIIDRQDKRIEDVHSNLNYWGIGFSLIAILTGLVVFLVNRSYANSAKKEAKLAAEKELKKWIDEKADEEFKSKVDVYLEEIDERAKKLFERNEGLTQKLEDKIKLLDEKEYTEDEKKELEEEIQEIKSSKNKNDYTFEDKYKLFVSKFVKENYQEALEDLNILEKEALSDNSLSKVLWFKAITLDRLEKSEEAIEVYNEVVKRFEDSKDNNILEQVAKALYNKGVTLGQLDRSEEALEVYDEVVKRFEDSKDNSILEKVAKALYNKGVSLGQLNRSGEATKVYAEVVERFKDSKDNSILNQVAKALVNKIETNLILNKSNSHQDLNLCFQLVKDDKNELIKYNMLTLLEKARDSELDNEIEEWKEEFKDISIENWSFGELKDWANSFENQEMKERLLKYIDIFENHNKK